MFVVLSCVVRTVLYGLVCLAYWHAFVVYSTNVSDCFVLGRVLVTVACCVTAALLHISAFLTHQALLKALAACKLALQAVSQSPREMPFWKNRHDFCY